MGRNWAIAVGINNYSNLLPLKYAEADAEAMRDWFEQEAKFDQVFLFTQDSPDIPAKPSSIPTTPTYGQIRRFLRSQFEKPLLKSGDNLWFFFAGHGRRDQERDYLMLSDSDPGDVEHTAISVDYVTQRLRRSGADNVLLFLDVCRDESRRGEGIRGEYKGVVTFYSCSPNQRAYEIEEYKRGSFTYALLEGLRIQGEGNCATVERLEQYLRSRVPQITYKHWKERQNPYASSEPATKLHLILLPDYATLTDILTLKNDAFQAEAEGDWGLAKQLWLRVNVAARGSDFQAIEAFSRIALRQGGSPDKELERFSFEVITVDETGQEVKRESGQAEYFTEDLGNGVTLDMVSIPGGSFMMGTEDEEIERLVKKFEWDGFRREKPQHKVTVKPFFLGKYQVTQAQWKAIASRPKINRDLESNPSYFKGDDLPVEKVSWEDAIEFCQRLSKQTGQEYRLPSEAEWEYACRAGTDTPFHFGETITGDLANYGASEIYANEPKGEYRQKTTPVGSFTPNAFGLYDMHGNVWEWCEDNWHENYENAPTDGSAWISEKSSSKVIRGGSWCYDPPRCRSAYRGYSPRADPGYFIGFRVACVAPSTLFCQSWQMGICRACYKESRPVPVMLAHPKIPRNWLA